VNATARAARRRHLDWHRVRVIAATDLRQLRQSRDFWLPMSIAGAMFFVVLPTILLFTITRIGSVGGVQQLSRALEVLPERTQAALQGDSAEARTAYALAVYLFAPLAVVVPLTISTAVGAATIVGERERGTGEFLAHSPASEAEVYLGKLIASLAPGYLTVAAGFGAYSLVVNVIAGPAVGHWFFPTPAWWVLVAWVIPPFLAVALSMVLRLSARMRSTAAAQQAAGLVTLPLILVAYGQATGSLLGATTAGWWVGALAWGGAAVGLRRGMKAMSRARLLGVADEQ